MFDGLQVSLFQIDSAIVGEIRVYLRRTDSFGFSHGSGSTKRINPTSPTINVPRHISTQTLLSETATSGASIISNPRTSPMSTIKGKYCYVFSRRLIVFRHYRCESQWQLRHLPREPAENRAQYDSDQHSSDPAKVRRRPGEGFFSMRRTSLHENSSLVSDESKGVTAYLCECASLTANGRALGDRRHPLGQMPYRVTPLSLPNFAESSVGGVTSTHSA
ncbi:hypothetical protein EDB83DRAFT_703360 [Lactarius deliciosus]|nr:hypothetical protein EDB83DRAFT_703360 [Lactarius deliciosus]